METRELLFELANPVRYGIVQEVAGGPKRLTMLAVQVDSSAPEVSRHLERLGEVGITEKNVDGSYSLAPIGQIIVNFLPCFEFIAREKEYFRTHDLSQLPPDLICRLGDLKDGELKQGELGNIELVLGILRRARSRLRVLTLESFRTSSPDGGSPLDSLGIGLDYRLVVDESYRFSETSQGQRFEGERDMIRVVAGIPAALVATENEAAVSFRDRDGRFDYSAGFYSTSNRFIEWCSDLVDYLWQRGSPVGTRHTGNTPTSLL